MRGLSEPWQAFLAFYSGSIRQQCQMPNGSANVERKRQTSGSDLGDKQVLVRAPDACALTPALRS